MAGHNKWSKVKHIKGAADAKRSKLFSKLAKEITVAARDGGGDVELNARLRQAVGNAKKQSLPGDTIERAIKKGTGEIEGVAYEEACYEGFGAGGVAFIVEVITDNKNRSFADLRTLFNKNNGNLGGPGCVAHMFERKGEIILSDDDYDEEEEEAEERTEINSGRLPENNLRTGLGRRAMAPGQRLRSGGDVRQSNF